MAPWKHAPTAAFVVAAACQSGDPAAPTSPVHAASVTSWADVSATIGARCVPCHVAGGLAEFPLTTFAEASPRAGRIADVVADGQMPPWLPSETCSALVDPRRLTPQEKRLILDWVRGGAVEGAPGAVARARPERLRELSRVDLTLDTGMDYVPDPAVHDVDVFRCFLVDTATAIDRFVVGWDVRSSPGSLPDGGTSPTQVLGVRFAEVDPAEAAARDGADPLPGWSCSGGLEELASARPLGRWGLRSGAVHLPAGVGARVRGGRALALEVHYHGHDPDAAPPAPERTRIDLELGQERPLREAEILPGRLPDPLVPPRTRGHTLGGQIALPAGVEVLGVEPRMHTFGVSLRADLVTSGGRSCLVDVPRWDYHWQELYLLASPPTVDAGAIDLRCVWDNLSDRPVRGSRALTGEECAIDVLVARPLR